MKIVQIVPANNGSVACYGNSIHRYKGEPDYHVTDSTVSIVCWALVSGAGGKTNIVGMVASGGERGLIPATEHTVSATQTNPIQDVRCAFIYYRQDEES